MDPDQGTGAMPNPGSTQGVLPLWRSFAATAAAKFANERRRTPASQPMRDVQALRMDFRAKEQADVKLYGVNRKRCRRVAALCSAACPST